MLFSDAGWNVIKALWGSDWNHIFSRDTEHALLRRFAATVDGKYQTLGAKDGAYDLANFFCEDPKVRATAYPVAVSPFRQLKAARHKRRALDRVAIHRLLRAWRIGKVRLSIGAA